MPKVGAKELRAVLEKEFPPSIRGLIVRAVLNGYQVVSDLYASDTWLRWPVGYDFKKYFRRIAVEYQLKSYIEAGHINVEAKVAPNYSGNYSHLELVSNRCVITISQVEHNKSFPRKAKYRDKLGYLSQQMRLDFFGEGDAFIKEPYYYGMLTYGYEEDMPQFINLGFPDILTRSWVERLELLSEPYELELPEREVIVAEEEGLVKLKEHIKRVKKHYEGESE